MTIPFDQGKHPRGDAGKWATKTNDVANDVDLGADVAPDGPSEEWGGGVANGGGEEWYVDGKLHRLDGPALQSDGGLANVGDEEWYADGKLHRLDGPASQRDGGLANGGEEWFVHGRRHRLDGPAEQWGGGVANGGTETWYRDGELYTPTAVELDDWESRRTASTS
jgi:hypothetical protein